MNQIKFKQILKQYPELKGRYLYNSFSRMVEDQVLGGELTVQEFFDLIEQTRVRIKVKQIVNGQSVMTELIPRDKRKASSMIFPEVMEMPVRFPSGRRGSINA